MRDRFGKFIYCGRYLIRVEEETVESDGNEDREMTKRTTLRAKMKTKMETDDGDETFNNVREVYGMGPATPWVTEQRPGPPLVWFLFGMHPSLCLRALLFTIIIMSSKKQPETNRISKIAGSFKRKLSSLHVSRAPTGTASGTPSSIEMDSSSDNPTK